MIKTAPTILVTGLGALIGQGIVAGLRADGRARIIGLDKRYSNFGASLCDAYELKPEVEEDSDAYLAFWESLLSRHKVDLVLPGISIDMYFLDAHRATFSTLGVAIGLNNSELIKITRDKFKFHHAMEDWGVPRIPTCIPASWENALTELGSPPFLLKPRRGEGSVGQARLRDAVDFQYWTQSARHDEWMIQKIVGADDAEYTVGAFGLADCGFLDKMIIMRRRLTRSGHTGHGEVRDHPVIEAASRHIMGRINAIGPTNLQFRLEDDRAYLLEINPRFSSSCSLRTAFGFNEAAMSLDFYLYGQRPALPTLRQGYGERYSADHVSYAGYSV